MGIAKGPQPGQPDSVVGGRRSLYYSYSHSFLSHVTPPVVIASHDPVSTSTLEIFFEIQVIPYNRFDQVFNAAINLYIPFIA